MRFGQSLERCVFRRGAVGWDGETLIGLRSEMLVLLRRRWFALSWTTLANQLTGYLMLDLSLRAVVRTSFGGLVVGLMAIISPQIMSSGHGALRVAGMLDLSLRAVGISLAELSIAQTFAAWSVGRLLGSLPITPGGIGVVELGLVGTLVAFGGHDAQVVAGVLLYRCLVLIPTLVLGAVAGLTWKLRR